MIKKLIAVCGIALMVAFSSTALADKKAEKRKNIDTMEAEIMAELFEDSSNAAKLSKTAYGHAVFSNLKVALGISGGGGSGVAIDGNGARTYMKMGTGGIGFGLGAQKYHVVFLFEDKKTFDSFVEKGWQADTQAGAAAGSAGANATSSFRSGVAAYQITDKGLIASADVSGTKYWKNKKLN